MQFKSELVEETGDIKTTADILLGSESYHTFLRALVGLMYDMICLAVISGHDLFSGEPTETTELIRILMCEYLCVSTSFHSRVPRPLTHEH